MNRNNYQLGSDNAQLNARADRLMNNITFLSNERTYAQRFPSYSSINYNDVDEQELIDDITELERIYAKLREENTTLHNNAYLYVLDDGVIYPNDGQYTTDLTTIVCKGIDGLSALKNAWKLWSIPPVLVMNSQYYCPGITINEVVE